MHYIRDLEHRLTQNLTRKNRSCGPFSNRSLRPPFFSGNLSAMCRISTAWGWREGGRKGESGRGEREGGREGGRVRVEEVRGREGG